jgi:hypothetical protein
MIFIRASATHQQSRCQFYSVAKVARDDEHHNYIAWFTAPKTQALLLGIGDTAIEAQGLCEGHWDSLRRTA